MKKALAIDIGGTKISSCIINENGEIISEINKCSTPKNCDEIFSVLKDICNKENDYSCVAIATAGAVNIDNTKVQGSSANMPDGYTNMEFCKLSDKKVFVENDANSAAWAEFKNGAAKGCDNAIMITLGTGIGGGVIINGKLFRGKSGMGAELGHIKINSYAPRKCTCKSENCFECYASGTGLKITLQDMAKISDNFKSSTLNNKEISDLTTYDLIDGVKNNDKFALEVFDIWHQQLSDGLLALQNVFDTEMIVLSGSMAKFVNVNLIENYINEKSVVSDVIVKLANYDNNSGMIGAALLALDKYC